MGWLLMISLLLPSALWAEAREPAQLSQQDSLLQASVLLGKNQNDSALTYLLPIVEDGRTQDTPLSLTASLYLGQAYLQDNQYRKALTLLNRLQATSATARSWETYTRATLHLAQLYEKIHRGYEAHQQLNRARSAIDRYGLDQLRVDYAIRMAYWHQWFGFTDSVQHYIQQTLQVAAPGQLVTHRADIYILRGLAEPKENYRTALNYFRRAVPLIKTIQDHSRLANVYNRITLRYAHHDHHRVALRYSDSTLHHCYRAVADGHEHLFTLHHAYQVRGDMFRRLGNLDSAYHYTKRGLSQEMYFMRQQQRHRIVEVTERYKDEQKSEQIRHQTAQLNAEQRQQYGLFIIIGLIGLLGVSIFHLYLRLRRANRITLQQSGALQSANQQLSEALDQQILLKGEIHHRVKNNLQVIISLLDLQREDINDPVASAQLGTMADRIYSMAAIHEILYLQDAPPDNGFLQYVEELCLHFSRFSVDEHKPLFTLNIEAVSFNLATAMPLGIILTELMTNSLKYGRVPGQILQIGITLTREEARYRLSYRDNGPGFPNGQLTERERGLGTYLLRSMVRQLQGTLHTHNQDGAHTTIVFCEKGESPPKDARQLPTATTYVE